MLRRTLTRLSRRRTTCVVPIMRKALLIATATFALLAPRVVSAAPVISAAGGDARHGGTVALTGSGFGTKSSAAPYRWDDCSGTDPHQKWDFVYPYTNDAAVRLAYRPPAEITRANGQTGGVPLPHSHATKYFAGAHYTSSGGDAHSGYNVCAGKNGQESFSDSYITFYTAIDPSWHFVSGDHNFKEYDYAAGDGYMGDGANLYFNRSGVEQAHGTWGGNYIEGMEALISSVNPQFMTYYPPPAGTVWSSVDVASPTAGWQRIELRLRHHNANGFHRVRVDNTLVWDITKVNDDTVGSGPRSETVIGGYAREYGNEEAYKNNWRYYSDIYYDHSFARVVVANAADYDKATIVEPQLPTAWSDGSITVTFNQGKLPDTGAAYVFVFDTEDTVSAPHAIQIGTSAPAPDGGAPKADAGSSSDASAKSDAGASNAPGSGSSGDGPPVSGRGAAPGATDNESGSGCRAAPGERRSPALLLGIVAGFGLVRRRHSRRARARII